MKVNYKITDQIKTQYLIVNIYYILSFCPLVNVFTFCQVRHIMFLVVDLQGGVGCGGDYVGKLYYFTKSWKKAILTISYLVEIVKKINKPIL